MSRLQKTLISWAIAFSLISLALPSYATEVDPSIYGKVLTSSNQPIAEVRVEALKDGSVVASTTSDATGSYKLNLEEGTYSFQFTPVTSDVSPLTSLPLDVPRDWAMNVVLTPPTTGRSFFGGYLGIDGGIAANQVGSAMFCNNGGNPPDKNGFFTLGLTAGTQCKTSFTQNVRLSENETLFMHLNDGPILPINQDLYLDVVAPITTTSIKVVDPNGKVLTPADGVYGVKLEVGGQNNFSTLVTANNQLSVKQEQKNYSLGKVSIFSGMQDFSASWNATSRNLVSESGEISLKRLTMTSNVLGMATVYIKNSKWIDGAISEVTIPASGGNLLVTVKPNNITTMSGRVTYSDGAPATSAMVSSGVQGVNTVGIVDGSGNYRASFPTGSGSSQFGISNSTRNPDGSSLSWEYSIRFRTQALSSDLSQDFVIPKPTLQQVSVRDGDGNLLSNALVQIGVYSENGRNLSGDPAYPLVSNLPKAQLSWQAIARTNSQGIAMVPAMQMSSPQIMWVSAFPERAGVWQGVNRTLTIGAGPINVQLDRRIHQISGTIRASENLNIPFPEVGFSNTAATSGVSGGGIRANAQGQYSLGISDGTLATLYLASRSQDSNNPDPLRFRLELPKSAAFVVRSSSAQDFVLPINFQSVKVVDSAGAPVIGARILMNVGSDKNPATVSLASNLPEFQGTYGGFSTTGIDGIASIPGLKNSQLLPATLTISTDRNSRHLGRQVQVEVGDRKEIVVVLSIRPPVINSLSSTSVRIGESVLVNGAAFLGATGVTIDGVPANFVVESDTRLRIFIPSNSSGGTVVISNAGGLSNASTRILVTQSPLTISTTSLSPARQGTAYQSSLSAVGGSAPYTWSRTAMALPNGLTLNSNGVIGGTPLQAGNWSFTVTVTDATGVAVSRVYSISVAADPRFVPGIPSDLRATQGSGRINLSWSPIISDNGNPILGYMIQTSTDQNQWTTRISSTGSRTNSFSFSVPLGTYFVRIAAINASGIGGFSTPAGPILIAAAPRSPINVTSSLSGANILVSWGAPATDNGSPISGYRIRISQDGRNWSTLISSTNSTLTNHTFTPAIKGRIFVQVAAINGIGLSTYTNAQTPVTIP